MGESEGQASRRDTSRCGTLASLLLANLVIVDIAGLVALSLACPKATAIGAEIRLTVQNPKVKGVGLWNQSIPQTLVKRELNPNQSEPHGQKSGWA